MEKKDKIASRLLQSGNLPALPQVLLQVIENCDREDLHLADLARIIDKDPAISSRVLTLMNSAYFGLHNRFATIEQAVVYLGADAIKNITVTASIQQVFSRLEKNYRLPLAQFWWFSFSSALYARRIAEQIGYANVEEAYLAGLLHNIGELLLWRNFADACAAIHESVPANCVEQCRAETEQLGINHCEAGALLIRHWKLSSFVADAALYHHAPLELIKGAFPLVKLIYLADRCCQAADLDERDPLYAQGEELFQLADSQVDALQSGVGEEVLDVAGRLEIPVEAPAAPQSTREESSLHEVSLLKQVKNYSLLNVFLQSLLQAEDRNAIFLAIEQGLNLLFHFEKIFFFLQDFEQRTLGGCSSTINPYADQLMNLVLPIEQETGLLMQALKQKRCIAATREEKPQPSIADAQLLDILGGKGMFCIPMIAKKKAIGVIVVAISEDMETDISKLEKDMLLKLLANQGALSLYLDDVKKKQEREIQVARRKSAAMVAAKVVHEVNNPLGIIKNYIKILTMKIPEKDRTQHELAILNEEIDRIAVLVQDLENFSTPLQPRLVRTDLNALLSDLLSYLARALFFSTSIEVNYVPASELPLILTDESSVKQIVINLLKNAREAMADGGKITITTSHLKKKEREENRAGSDEKNVSLIIEDDGPGLPAAIRPQLFEPFSTTKGKGHPGLGLSIVKALVTELHGAIHCSTGERKGTCFTITFPVAY